MNKHIEPITVRGSDMLSMVEVNDYVEPLVKYCQEVKEQIYACKTIEDVNAIVIDYSTVITNADDAES